MKYLLLCCHDEKKFDAMPKSECDAMMEETRAYCEALKKSGHLLGVEQLEPINTAMSVKVRNGKLAVIDGPFAETKEQVGGYFLIDARDLNEAVQVASKFPSVRFGTMEVRPVRDIPGSGRPDELKLVMTRVFDAPPEAVWRAWTDTESFRQWFKSKDDVNLLSVKMDVRIGGKYRIQTKHPGGEYFTAVGVYREVSSPERLLFTWAWEKDGSEPDFGEVEAPETLVTVELRASGKQTEMVFTQTNFASAQSRDNHQRGWSAYFDQLALFVKQ